MALVKKIIVVLGVVLSLVPSVYLFLQDHRLWAAVWSGGVIVAVVVYVIGRDRGLAAYIFTVACLALLGYSTVTLGEDGRPIALDLPRAVVGLVILAVVVGSAVFLASDFIFATRGRDRWRSFLYLLYWILGMSGTYREVKDGDVTAVKSRSPAFKANAAELITVQADHAVVLERGGTYTRVSGPGQLYTEPGERIKKVVRTSGQSVRDKVKDVFTKDEIPVTVGFSVSFRIMPDPTKKVELGKPYPVSEEALLKAVYNVGHIEGAMKDAAGNLLRDKINQCALDDIYDPLHPDTFPLGDIRIELKEKLANIAKNWGMVVFSFGINPVEVPEKVRDQMLERWQAAWARNERVEKERTEREAASIRAEKQKIDVEAKVAKVEAEARAERIREVEKARSKEEIFNGYLNLLERHVGPVDMHTAAALLQTLLMGEVEPSRMLPYLRSLPTTTTGYTREQLLETLGLGIVGPSGGPTAPRQLGPAGQSRGKASSADRDTQKKKSEATDE